MTMIVHYFQNPLHLLLQKRHSAPMEGGGGHLVGGKNKEDDYHDDEWK